MHTHFDAFSHSGVYVKVLLVGHVGEGVFRFLILVHEYWNTSLGLLTYLLRLADFRGFLSAGRGLEYGLER